MSITTAEPPTAEKAAKVRLFLQEVTGRSQRIDDLAEQLEREHLSPREEFFAKILTDRMREASWIMRGLGFPDGLPLNRQNPRKLAMWEIFCSALNDRMWGNDGDGHDTETGAGPVMVDG